MSQSQNLVVSVASRSFDRLKNARRRPYELVIAIVALALLAVMTQMVHEHEVPAWEVATFEVINSFPDLLYYFIWPFMQYGVFVTIPMVSAIAFYFKRYRLATLLLVGGVGIYYLARFIKEVFPRGRPGDVLEGIKTRESFAPWSTGFTSGHAAVAATIATFSHYYLSKKWQFISIFTLVVVVIGRIYVGAHLPLDVFGGVALGVAVASLINFIVGIPEPKKVVEEDTKEWIRRHRPRHPGDIIRMIIAASFFTLTTVFALTGIVGPLEEAAFRLVNLLPSALSPLIQLIMQFGALAFVFVAAVYALLFKHYRLSLKILAGGVGVWTLARIAKILVDRERPFYILNEIVERAGNSGILGFPSGHASVAALIATVAAPYVSKNWSRVFWAAAIITGIGRIYVGAHLPLDIIAGLSLGWFVGSLMNIGFGTPAKPWPKKAIEKALGNAKLKLRSLKAAKVDARGSVPLFGETIKGKKIFIKLIDNEHRNADLLYRLWRYLTLRGVEDEAPFTSAKQLAEHEAYVSIQASQAGVSTPKVLLATPVDRQAWIIVTEKIDGVILKNYAGEFSRNLLLDVWGQAKKLHNADIAHRDLRTTNIMIDKQSKPWLIDFSFSHTAANDFQRKNDLIELMTTLSLQADKSEVVSAAISVFGKDRIKEIRPQMQESVLSAYTRKAISHDAAFLSDLVDEITTQTEGHRVPRAQLGRRNLRWVIFISVGILAAIYLVPQLEDIDDAIEAVEGASLPLLLATILASVLTYLLSALTVMGATTKRLNFGLTWLVQFGTTALNRITPKGVGGALLTEQYLEKHGHSRIESTAAVTLVYSAGIVMHVFLTILVITILGPSLLDSVSLTSDQILLFTVIGVFTVSGVMFITRVKNLVFRWGHETIKSLRRVLKRPLKLLQLFGGSAGITLTYALAFSFSIDAFGGGLSYPDALLVYLASNVLAAAAPTPGGLGAAEAALVVGLTLYNLEISHAIAAVLTFRLITFWLPIIPGIFALRYLRRHHRV